MEFLQGLDRNEACKRFLESEGLLMFMARMENNQTPPKEATEEALYQTIKLLIDLFPNSRDKGEYCYLLEKEKNIYLLMRNRREISKLASLFSKLEKEKKGEVTELDYREYYNDVLVPETKDFSDEIRFKLNPEQICRLFIADQNSYLDLMSIIEDGYFKLGMSVMRNDKTNSNIFEQTNLMVKQLELEEHIQNLSNIDMRQLNLKYEKLEKIRKNGK